MTKKKLNIGLVCPYNIFLGGGVQECVLALNKELKKRGHTAKIITPQPKNCPEKISKDIVFVGGSATVKSFHTTAQVSVTVNIDMVENVLEQEDFDILHFHEPSVPIVSRQILSRSSSANIATFHAKLPDNVMSKTLERVITPYTKSILKGIDAITAVSSASASYIESLTDETVNIVPNGIDLKKYKKGLYSRIGKLQQSEMKTIFYVGRLEKRKGLKYLLDSFSLLEERGLPVRLIIAGGGPDRKKLEHQARDLNLKNYTFLGHISEKHKITLYQSADVFCSPALYGESFGIVLLEAMACNTPIVGGNNPGYITVMKDRGSISLVDPRDREKLADRLQLVLFDEPLRKLLLSWSKSYVKKYDYTKIVDQYEQIYYKALDTFSK
jgi:phosphatidyl-myo-inositol alpha-mannosyltransferase